MEATRISNTKYHISSVKFAQPNTKESEKVLVKYLKRNKIDTIINVSDYKTSPHIISLYKKNGVKNLLTYTFPDKFLEWDEYRYFVNILQEIYQNLAKTEHKNVLVHCTAGINRSAMTIAYLLKKTTTKNTNEIIKEIRKSNRDGRGVVALTNPTFETLLISYI